MRTPLSNHRKRIPRLWHFCLGFGFSFLVTWVAGILFLDTIPPLVLDAVVQRAVYAPGTVLRYRSEGHGDTHIGEHGLSGDGPERLKSKELVVIFGDSFVEALQVDDTEKMQARFNSFAEQRGLPHRALAIGRFADSVADYYFLLPRYQQLFQTDSLHVVVVLGALDDIIPGQSVSCRSGFQAQDGSFAFVEHECPPKASTEALRFILYEWQLQNISTPVAKLLAMNLSLLQRRPPPTTCTGPGYELEPKAYTRAWNFLLESMKARTGGKLTFVYAPQGPKPGPKSPEGVLGEDAEQKIAKAFEASCETHGISFIDLSEDFRRAYAGNRLFPRGFSMSPPGRGHLNPVGHEIVARAILRHVTAHWQERTPPDQASRAAPPG